MNIISSQNGIGILLLLAVGVMGGGCQVSALPGGANGSFPFTQVARFDEVNFKELSGIVYHPVRKTLFAVGDKGYITEIRTDGAVVAQKRVRQGADLEGITCRPETGMLYVVVEGDDTILEVNPEVLEVTREIPVDRRFDNRVLIDPGDNGLEGITFYAHNAAAHSSTFYLVNQSKALEGPDPSIVLEVEVDDTGTEPARITRYFSLGVTGLSGIHYDPASQHLLVISDNEDWLVEAGLRGRVLKMVPLPGANQEGITLDEAGFLYIAQDSKKGVLKFEPPR